MFVVVVVVVVIVVFVVVVVVVVVVVFVVVVVVVVLWLLLLCGCCVCCFCYCCSPCCFCTVYSHNHFLHCCLCFRTCKWIFTCAAASTVICNSEKILLKVFQTNRYIKALFTINA